MIKFSEYVSLGHPDKVADYISQYLLDRYIEHDPQTRYAVEVQIKGNQVTLGGEVSSKHHFSSQDIAGFVREAVNEIGYTRRYQQKWGAENTICGDMLNVSTLISQQSPDIAQGLPGWGDQGIFFGYASPDRSTCRMPYEHTIAKRICKHLFDSGIGGLDIKAQVITDDWKIKKLIVAIPLLDGTDEKPVRDYMLGVAHAGGIASDGCELKSELAALDRKIQLELAPPTPEITEKEHEGQQVKPEAKGVRNGIRQYPEDTSPQIRNPSESIIANHTITGHPGLYAKEETRSKGLKI